MARQDLYTYLKDNDYPGRGILLGLREDGCAVIAYFIMGRSENSRNRVFETTQDGIRTCAADPEKMQDPSLIIYAPVRRYQNTLIVTNGDQTDTIYEALSHGGSFEQALRTRTFEPDPENYTPRISGTVISQPGGAFSYALSILKSTDNNPAAAQRFFYEYEAMLPGTGRLIHTYMGDGNPLPSFTGEPVNVAVEGEIDEFGQKLWESLSAQNKVSLFVRTISPQGEEQTRIYNRMEKR